MKIITVICPFYNCQALIVMLLVTSDTWVVFCWYMISLKRNDQVYIWEAYCCQLGHGPFHSHIRCVQVFIPLTCPQHTFGQTKCEKYQFYFYYMINPMGALQKFRPVTAKSRESYVNMRMDQKNLPKSLHHFCLLKKKNLESSPYRWLYFGSIFELLIAQSLINTSEQKLVSSLTHLQQARTSILRW